MCKKPNIYKLIPKKVFKIVIYIHWLLSALLALLLVWWVDYSEIEEANGVDKSPKHRLIFSLKNKVTFSFIVLYMLLIMVI